MDKTDDGDDTGAAGGEQVGLDSEAEVGDGDGQGGGSAGKGADNGEEELSNDGDPSQVHAMGRVTRVLGGGGLRLGSRSYNRSSPARYKQTTFEHSNVRLIQVSSVGGVTLPMLVCWA